MRYIEKYSSHIPIDGVTLRDIRRMIRDARREEIDRSKLVFCLGYELEESISALFGSGTFTQKQLGIPEPPLPYQVGAIWGIAVTQPPNIDNDTVLLTKLEDYLSVYGSESVPDESI